jgi:hypothetical protein
MKFGFYRCGKNTKTDDRTDETAGVGVGATSNSSSLENFGECPPLVEIMGNL